jgi:hypothetical protein
VNHRSPFNSNITTVLYQIDSLTGPWQKATITAGAGSPSVTWQATVTTPLDYGQHTIYVAALDATSGTISSSDGNVSNSPFVGAIASYTFTVGISDTTPPTIVNLTPLQTYIYNAPLTPNFYALDYESGIASVTATLNGNSVLSGQTVTLNQVGSNLLSVTATDNAGNSQTNTYSFNVTYDIRWLPPMKYIDESSSYTYTMQDGSTLPIKWVMYDYFGNPVADPAVVVIVLDRANPANNVTFIQGTSDDQIRFDTSSNSYIVNLHTRNYPWMQIGGIYDVKIGRAEGYLLELLAPSDFQLVEKGVAKGK